MRTIKRHCAYCFKELDSPIPWKCRYCGEYFCADHRLPENHSCTHFSPSKWPAKDYVDRGSVPSDVSLRDWLEREQQDVKKIKKTKVRKLKSPKKIAVFSIIALIILFSVTAFGYYIMDSNLSDVKQEIQVLRDGLDETLTNINSSNDKLSGLESQLVQYQYYLNENNSELSNYTTGNEYKLHNPFLSEVLEFVDEDNSENDRLMIENAKKQGLRCAYVEVDIIDGVYPLVGFDTIDEGMTYFESITDYRVFPVINKSYVDCVQDEPYYATSDDTILEILIFW
ncbi:MAG: zinc finger AN1 domain-containing stress-associated protein [Candidatus Tenebribacter burtonii]|nr:zinc finger AN1 domain-containing stress-associated protein [Candidatus Tenebribacter burtonii]